VATPYGSGNPATSRLFSSIPTPLAQKGYDDESVCYSKNTSRNILDRMKHNIFRKTNTTTAEANVTALADASSRGTAEPVAILDESKVEELTSLSRTTRWRMERRGEFPKRVRLSPGRVGWRQAEIEAWIRSRGA